MIAMPVEIHRTTGGIPHPDGLSISAIGPANLGLGSPKYSRSPVKTTPYDLPLFPATSPGRVSVHRLLPDVMNGSLSAGVTHYQGLMLVIGADMTATSLELDIVQPETGSASLWIQAAAAGVTIASSVTEPSGASWSSSTQTITVTPGSEHLVWVRRVIPSSSVASAFESILLTLSDPDTETVYASRTWVSWYNLRSAAVTFTSVTSTSDDVATRSGDRVDFTVTLSADSPGDKVYVVIDSTEGFEKNLDTQSNIQAAEVDLCTVEAGTGAYSYSFHPPAPGYYGFLFLTGERAFQKTLQVQP